MYHSLKDGYTKTDSVQIFTLIMYVRDVRRSAPNPHYIKTYLTLRCDFCGREFEQGNNVKLVRSRPRHYCDLECHRRAMLRGGVADLSRRKTCRERYGSDYLIARRDVASAASKRGNSPEGRAKARASLDRRWTDQSKRLSHGLLLPRSKPELEFLSMLSERLGRHLDSQHYVNRWWIDVYDPLTDAHIEFDGRYWHNRDQARLNKDTRQNAWFAEAKIPFRRVKEEDWIENKEKAVKEVLDWIEQLRSLRSA